MRIPCSSSQGASCVCYEVNVLEDRRVRWPDLEVRHNPTGSSQTSCSIMTRPRKSYCYGELCQKNMLETLMRIFYSQLQDFSRSREAILMLLPLLDSDSRNVVSATSIEELSDFQRKSIVHHLAVAYFQVQLCRNRSTWCRYQGIRQTREHQCRFTFPSRSVCMFLSGFSWKEITTKSV